MSFSPQNKDSIFIVFYNLRNLIYYLITSVLLLIFDFKSINFNLDGIFLLVFFQKAFNNYFRLFN